MALRNHPQAETAIQGLLTRLLPAAAESEEARAAADYLRFLLGLTKAEDKKAFLEKADRGLVEALQKMIGGDE